MKNLYSMVCWLYRCSSFGYHQVGRDTSSSVSLFWKYAAPASKHFLIILKECQRALGWKKVEKVIGQQNEWSTDEAAITQKQGLEIDKSSYARFDSRLYYLLGPPFHYRKTSIRSHVWVVKVDYIISYIANVSCCYMAHFRAYSFIGMTWLTWLTYLPWLRLPWRDSWSP